MGRALPSVLAAIATALLIAALAARFYGDFIGLLTGLIQLTCMYTLNWGRLAEVNMILCAAVTAAMVCFACGSVPPNGSETEPSKPNRWLQTGFYLATGLAFLAKGPIALAFIFLAVISFVIARATQRELCPLRFLADPFGIHLLLDCLVIWPVLAYIAYPPIIQAWRDEMSTTASGGFGHSPIYTYLHAIPYVLLPWTPLMALGAGVGTWRAISRGCLSPLGQFFLCWFLPGFVILHFIALKSHHYPMPLLPPFSILGAIGFDWLIRQWQDRRAAAGTSATSRPSSSRVRLRRSGAS